MTRIDFGSMSVGDFTDPDMAVAVAGRPIGEFPFKLRLERLNEMRFALGVRLDFPFGLLKFVAMLILVFSSA